MAIYWTSLGPNILIHPLWIAALVWSVMAGSCAALLALRWGWIGPEAQRKWAGGTSVYLILTGLFLAAYAVPCYLALVRTMLDSSAGSITLAHVKGEAWTRTVVAGLLLIGTAAGPAWLRHRLARRRAAHVTAADGPMTESV